MKAKFFRCPQCGNVIVKTVDSGVGVVCCGEPMEELIPHQKEEYNEKHLPVVTWKDDHTIHVKVGSVEHPMLPEHKIVFLYVESECSGRIVWLKDKPEADICVCGTKPTAVYEYCNIHGLWKTEVECPTKCCKN